MANNHDVSRRAILVGGAALTTLGASMFGFDQLFGYRQVFGQEVGDDLATILNLAATSETLACTHYYNVLTESTIALTPLEINTLKAAMDSELQHLLFLNANGGKTLATEFYFPQNVYIDRQQFSEITELAESAFVAAYLAAVRRITELGQPLIAAVAAQIAAIEQVHLGLVRQIGGREPNNISLGQALIYNVSEAVPILQPFLEGGTNRIGPRAFPGEAAIREVIGDVSVLTIKPFTDPTATTGTTSNTAESGDCIVTSGGNFRVNIRSGAGLAFAIIGKLTPKQLLRANGQSKDADGFTWYKLQAGGFVRSDVVRSTGDCTVLPVVAGS